MNRTWILVKGELQRLHKYNLTTVSFAVAILWGGLLYFIDDGLLDSLLPMVLMMDATMMALMYVGAIMYFEKSESTISTLLVTPITNNELLLSKVIANTAHNVFSSALLIIVFSVLRDVEINYILITIAIILSTCIHTIIGICLSYTTKDFTSLLMRVISFAFVLMLPSLLMFFNVFEGWWIEAINLVNPVNAALQLIEGSFGTEALAWQFWVSLAYLFFGGIALFKFYALPKFQDYAVKQSGV